MKKNVVLVKVNTFFPIFIGYYINVIRIAMMFELIQFRNICTVDRYKDNCELEIELREELTTASPDPCTRNSQRVNG